MYKSPIKDPNNNCNKSLLSDFKEKLIQAIKRIKHEVDECCEAESQTYLQSIHVESSFDGLEREIQAEFQNLHRFLHEEESRDLQRLKKEREKRVKMLRERERKIALQGRDLERAIATLNSTLAAEDSPTLLKEIQDLLKRSNVAFIPPPYMGVEVRSGQFVGPIQYRIWKHMKTCLYPNITEVTFDPETAHPLLTLSPSCTSVWFEENKVICAASKEEDAPSPRRFHYYYSVLGREGFLTGRHYWEVEVGRKTAWRVGVAREDVHRGEMDSCGTSSGLWTLSLKGGAVLACTEPKPTKITVSIRPVRIGVFLDCEKEEVAFYNAVTMTPLYTFFMGVVPVPLIPFYNPCDSDDGKNLDPLNLFRPSL
ncbi:zinc-binding protein A33 [Esox lucius]|uniref:B30.2/SPRY domain-containing protein n=1 Tax=Esox lucius TaxID=8010 RepID=A0A3P8ZLA8_ESOLU|nr:zinc-binding protein A33 [Esox lucius]XP_010867078.2 zinc-binding protein A33 [Esox lucius]XP_010867079.2 zinc-binding protein A33 [Esox lucius]